MKQLLKYILIVNIILIFLGVLIISTSLLYEDYKNNYYTQEKIDSIRARGETVPLPPKDIFYNMNNWSFYLHWWIIPMIIILISGLYQFKNANIKGYFKSLSIPLSYVIMSIILLLIYRAMGVLEIGEETGFTVLFTLMQLIMTFVSILVINIIIYLIFKNK